MNTLLIVSLLILPSVYCKEKILGGWAQSTDSSLIGECLRKVLHHIKAGEDINALQSQVSNILCQTQIVNGINIKLDFDLQNQRWQCSFYKSFVPTLRVQYESCTPSEIKNPSVNHDKVNEEEVNIDQLNDNEFDEDMVDMASNNENDQQDWKRNQDSEKDNPAVLDEDEKTFGEDGESE